MGSKWIRMTEVVRIRLDRASLWFGSLFPVGIYGYQIFAVGRISSESDSDNASDDELTRFVLHSLITVDLSSYFQVRSNWTASPVELSLAKQFLSLVAAIFSAKQIDFCIRWLYKRLFEPSCLPIAPLTMLASGIAFEEAPWADQ
jgi:hypothetical protein